MSSKVLLVDPPFHGFFEYDRWWYSFSLTQLAACLQEAGIETYVYDADKYCKKDPLTKDRTEMVRRQEWYQKGVQNDNHYIWNNFRKVLKEINPSVIGVTTWTSKMQSTLKLLEICKSYDAGIKTCVGGYHASVVPDDFRDNPLIDAIFTGPAEKTLPLWIINGCKEKFIISDPKSVDLKNIPSFSRESLLSPEHFSPNDMGALMTSRGCPYNCSFCSNNILYAQKYHMKNVELVRKEVEHVIDKYSPNHLFVADANFFVNLKETLKMAEVFKYFRVPWGCEGRIDAINDDLVEKLIDCGCSNMSFGIETGTTRGMKIINKDITVEQVQRASEILNKHKITWKCFFIVGFPHETVEDMEQTRRFALSIKANYISINSYVPLPGTDIYKSLAPIFDKIKDEIYQYNQLNPRTTFIKGISPDEYKELFLKITNDFDAYNRSIQAVDAFHGENGGLVLDT
jgi:anaerobic magnesium-protoporphyrin IX monomethyl ester cyclase